MWEEELRKNIEFTKREKCGYCGNIIQGMHDRHSSKFPDVENPICKKCNWDIEIPRRVGTISEKNLKEFQEKNR